MEELREPARMGSREVGERHVEYAFDAQRVPADRAADARAGSGSSPTIPITGVG